jgi:hypothetical protein
VPRSKQHMPRSKQQHKEATIRGGSAAVDAHSITDTCVPECAKLKAQRRR